MGIIIARLVQLVTRIVAAFLLAKGYAEAQHAESIAVAAGELTGAAVATVIDLIIHSACYGKLKRWMEDPAGFGDAPAKDHEGADVVGKINNNSLLILSLACLLAGAAIGTISGCAQTETNRAAQGMILVAEHANVATTLYQAGALSLEQAREISRLCKIERDSVNAYYDAIQSGDSARLAAAKAALAAAVKAAELELAKYPPPDDAATIATETQRTQRTHRVL